MLGLPSLPLTRGWQGWSDYSYRRRVLHCKCESFDSSLALPFLTKLLQPQAIRTTLDVYGENVRKIMPIDSPVFGRVFNVCIGAMMVGSVNFTVKEGDTIARGQEFGFFAFGTS